MRTLEHLRQLGLKAWRAAEAPFDAAFGSALNPLRHLGALATLAFALLVASGAVLYIVLDTSVHGAYGSIRALADWPLGSGALLRGVHRFEGGATTHSIVMRSKTGTVRLVEAQHNFNRKTWMGGDKN